MRLIAFALIFLILLPAGILAAGLEITQLEARVDYDEAYAYKLEDRYHKDRATYALVPLSNDSKIKVDAFPGSNLTFTIKTENTIRGNSPSINKVIVRATIEGVDDNTDLEQESTDIDLEPGDEQITELKFGIPVSADSGMYNVLVTADGEDSNRTPYLAQLRLKLEVKKLSHDIRITTVSLSPGVVDCSRRARLTATIRNTGGTQENDVALEFKSASLGINSYDREITLLSSNNAKDEEKMHTKTLEIEALSFLKSGTYPISINLYWKGFILFDQKNLQLTVRDCARGAKSADSRNQETNKTDTAIQASDQKKDTEGLITTTIETAIFNSPVLWLFFLAVIIVVILLTSIAVVFFDLRKPH